MIAGTMAYEMRHPHFNIIFAFLAISHSWSVRAWNFNLGADSCFSCPPESCGFPGGKSKSDHWTWDKVQGNIWKKQHYQSTLKINFSIHSRSKLMYLFFLHIKYLLFFKLFIKLNTLILLLKSIFSIIMCEMHSSIEP